MKMNWDYVAGFLDGEGCVSIRKQKGWRKLLCEVTITQKYGCALDEIATFLNEHGIKAYVAQSPTNKRREVKVLYISDLRSVQTFLNAVKEKVIIKRAKVEDALLLNYDPRWTKLTETEIQKAIELWRQGFTYSQIGTQLKRDRFGISKILKRRL